MRLSLGGNLGRQHLGDSPPSSLQLWSVRIEGPCRLRCDCRLISYRATGDSLRWELPACLLSPFPKDGPPPQFPWKILFETISRLGAASPFTSCLLALQRGEMCGLVQPFSPLSPPRAPWVYPRVTPNSFLSHPGVPTECGDITSTEFITKANAVQTWELDCVRGSLPGHTSPRTGTHKGLNPGVGTH